MNAEGPAAQAARCRKTFDVGPRDQLLCVCVCVLLPHPTLTHCTQELDENKNGTLDRKELFGLLRKMVR